jgi:4'-phosphopantetheinyl transferase
MNVPRSGDTCEVWWASTADAALAPSGVLSADERDRHARWRRAEDRDRFLVGRVLLRLVLARALATEPAAVDLTSTEPHGKPHLARASRDLEFSVSHSGERVVVAFAVGAPVGVDVQRVRADLSLDRVGRALLSADETEAMARVPAAERPQAFAVWWTRKEALVKATGEGLSVPLSSFAVTPPDQPAAVIRAHDPRLLRARLWDLDAGPGYAASLAVLGGCRGVVHRDGSALIADSATPPPSRSAPG